MKTRVIILCAVSGIIIATILCVYILKTPSSDKPLCLYVDHGIFLISDDSIIDLLKEVISLPVAEHHVPGPVNFCPFYMYNKEKKTYTCEAIIGHMVSYDNYVGIAHVDALFDDRSKFVTVPPKTIKEINELIPSENLMTCGEYHKMLFDRAYYQPTLEQLKQYDQLLLRNDTDIIILDKNDCYEYITQMENITKDTNIDSHYSNKYPKIFEQIFYPIDSQKQIFYPYYIRYVDQKKYLEMIEYHDAADREKIYYLNE